MIEPAPAKINLALHVRSRRENGYHEIETLFAFLSTGDRLEAREAEQDSFAITGDFASALDAGSGNLVLRAQQVFAAEFGKTGALDVTLNKNLPIASGIGGGSADAAAMLRILAYRQNIALDDPRLIDCAVRLGADVPACLAGQTAFGRGTGTDLVPMELGFDLPILLVNPGVELSTAAVFAGWNGRDRGGLDLDANGALHGAFAARNDLEPVACALAPVIADVLALLSAQPGMIMTRMSGSGATCFALFRNLQACLMASQRIATRHPDWWLYDSRIA